MVRAATIIGIAVLLAGAPSGNAAFIRVDEVAGVNGLFITREGQRWHMSTQGGWITYDDNFNQVSTTSIPGVGQVRGIDFDPVSGLMVFNDFSRRLILQATLGGSIVSSRFDSGISQTNGISVDPRDGTIWLARFVGRVEQVNADGTVLRAFDTGFNLTGIAVDPVHETLFLMRADGPGGAGGPFDDEIYEFSFTGANLGLVIGGGDIAGNGQGLEYLPDLGRLYVTAQGEQRVIVFEDPTRIAVPEPAGSLQVAIALLSLLISSRRFWCGGRLLGRRVTTTRYRDFAAAQ